MTREEAKIIKALECCGYNAVKCFECPYMRKSSCGAELMKDCYDLLNRKNAEIERVTKDRYLYNPDGKIELLPRTDLDEIRAEAIKEFAERLKGEHFKVPVDAYHSAYVIGDDDIDQIAKEMGVETDV